MCKRIQIGNAKHPGYQRTSARAATRTHGYIVFPGPAYEVSNDQKVAREAHAAHDIQFAMQAIVIRHRRRFSFLCRDVLSRKLFLQQPLQACHRFGLEECLFCLAFGNRERRQNTFAQLQIEITALCYCHRIADCRRDIRKQLRHFSRALEVLLVAVVLGPVRVCEAAALTNAHPRFVCVVTVVVHKAHIIGRNDGHRLFAGQHERGLHARFFLRTPGSHQLKVKAFRENFLPGLQAFFRQRWILVQQRLPDVATRPPRQCDKAGTTCLIEPFRLQHRHATILPFKIRSRQQLREVSVAEFVLTQYDELMRTVRFILIRNREVSTDQRLNACGNRLTIKFYETEQVVLVG